MRWKWLVMSLIVAGAAACTRQPEPKEAGEAYFRGLGCVKCHAIGPDGGTWGPNLTFIGFRKSPEWLDLWLKNPHAWNSNTVMSNFNLPDSTRQALVSYLSAQKGQAFDKGGRPWNDPHLDPAYRGEVLFNKAGCVACHAHNGAGGYPNNNVAGGKIPALTKVSETYTKDELLNKIKHGVVPTPSDSGQPAPMIRMPKWGDVLSDDEINAVVEFLFSLGAKSGASAKEQSW